MVSCYAQLKKNNMSKTTFISYSWDNENHTDWVLNLGNSLVSFGLDVILDQYD